MKDRSLIAKNYFYNLIWQLSAIVIPLITVPYLTRIVGATGLGEFSMAYSIAYYFTIFIKLGVDNYGSREIAYNRKNTDNVSRTFWEIFLFQIFLGMIVTMIYSIWAFGVASNSKLSLIMVVVLISATVDTNWCVSGLEQFVSAAKRDIFIKSFAAVLIIIVVKSANDVWKYAVIYVAGLAFTQIISISVIARYVRFVPVTFQGICGHIKPNMVMLFPVLAVSMYMTMDKIMIGFLSNEGELGFYHAAEYIIKVPMAFINALGTIMLPRISNMIANKGDKDTIVKMVNYAFLFSAFVSSILSFGIMGVSQEFVPLFYGPGFDKCILLFYIFLPSTIFMALSSVLRTQLILPQKMDRLYLLSLLSGALTNLVFNVLLIPTYGAIGAAIGSLIAYLSIYVVQMIGVRKQLKLKKLCCFAIIMIVPGIIECMLLAEKAFDTFNMWVWLVIKILLCGAVYLIVLMIEIVLLMLLNIIDLSCLDEVKNVLRSRKITK